MKPLSSRLRAELFTQLAQLESSGLPFSRSIALVEVSAAASPRLEAMRKRVAKGDAPAMAGEKSGVFTRLEARLVHAAWTAGGAAGMYRRLAAMHTQRAMQLSTMKSRMMLPAFVLCMALLLRPLPALIGGTIGFGGYLFAIATPLLLLTMAFFAGRALWRHLIASAASSPAPTLLLSLPVAGTLLVRRNVRDFLESLALMLEAGISMLDALPLAVETLEIGALRRQFAQLAPAIEKGQTLSQALWNMPHLTGLDSGARAVEFAHTGEQSGALPEMLLRHVAMETETIDATFRQIAEWAPRIIYAAVVLWVALGIIRGGALVARNL